MLRGVGVAFLRCHNRHCVFGRLLVASSLIRRRTVEEYCNAVTQHTSGTPPPHPTPTQKQNKTKKTKNIKTHTHTKTHTRKTHTHKIHKEKRNPKDKKSSQARGQSGWVSGTLRDKWIIGQLKMAMGSRSARQSARHEHEA